MQPVMILPKRAHTLVTGDTDETERARFGAVAANREQFSKERIPFCKENTSCSSKIKLLNKNPNNTHTYDESLTSQLHCTGKNI